MEEHSRQAARLDTPRELRRRLLRRPLRGEDRFGVFAERFARFMGTARFLMYMSGFVVVWVLLNLIGLYGLRWDPYPFILLNLFFSVQASYAAPLILLAQNRQEDRDRVVAEQDRQADAAADADMEYLAREVASLRMAVGEVATRDYLRSELKGLLNELEERATPSTDPDDTEAERDQDDAVRTGRRADPGSV
ncbi:MAG: DUF1003 domain-containing protein [Marmoricola sp.]